MYRVYGGAAKPGRSSWSPEPPTAGAGPGGWAWRHGLPPANTGTHVIVGVWDGGGGAIIRPALPIPGYPGSGGATEIYFPGGIGNHIIPIGGWPQSPPISMR